MSLEANEDLRFTVSSVRSWEDVPVRRICGGENIRWKATKAGLEPAYAELGPPIAQGASYSNPRVTDAVRPITSPRHDTQITQSDDSWEYCCHRFSLGLGPGGCVENAATSRVCYGDSSGDSHRQFGCGWGI
jgi:hypothetical protein